MLNVTIHDANDITAVVQKLIDKELANAEKDHEQEVKDLETVIDDLRQSEQSLKADLEREQAKNARLAEEIKALNLKLTKIKGLTA